MKPTNSAAVVVIKDDKVLLVREEEKSGHIIGMLGLPGGRIEENEAELDGAIRELAEETGLIAKREDCSDFPGNFFQADIPRKSGITRFNWTVFRVQNYSGELKGNEQVTPIWYSIKDLEQMDKDGLLIGNVFNAVMAALKAE